MTSEELSAALTLIEDAWGILPPSERVTWGHALAGQDLGAIAEAVEVERNNPRPPLMTLLTRSKQVAGPCRECNGTGWLSVDDPDFPARSFVKACACREPKDHPRGCSCGACHYGAHRWADIIAGRDGRPDAAATLDTSAGMTSARDAVAALARSKQMPEPTRSEKSADDDSESRADLA